MDTNTMIQRNISCSIACWYTDLATVNTAADGMGWGPGALTVPLYGTGGTVRYYACHTWVDTDFFPLLDTRPDIKALIYTFSGVDPKSTWAELLQFLNVTDIAP